MILEVKLEVIFAWDLKGEMSTTPHEEEGKPRDGRVKR